jgi:hypothetical protein
MAGKPKSNKQKRLLLRRKTEQKVRETQKARDVQKIKKEQSVALALKVKSLSRHPQEVLDDLLNGKTTYVPNAHGLANISTLFYQLNRSKQELKILHRILSHCFKIKVNFFNVSTGLAQANVSRALKGIIKHKDFWLREPETWSPTSHNAQKQFSSFLRHLFAKYPVPLFMNQAWFGDNADQEKWFIHVGSGQNIRTAERLPMPLTKMMAHHFLRAPDNFDILSAFRWGQLKTMNADERAIRAILATRVGTIFDEQEFWASVFVWFIANPMLDTVHYAPIVDYIYHQKFVGAPPAQPNLSMKKRSVEATLRQVEEWHRRFGTDRKTSVISWPSSGIKSLNHTEGKGLQKISYETVELLSTKDLRQEGSTMHHCVASYANSCASGDVSIWSLRSMDSFAQIHYLLTIEVSNANKIVRQARGKWNERPTAKTVGLLDEWGRQAGLRNSSWLI